MEAEASEGSSYFQTTIRMGKRDMQDETKRAVEIELAVGFLGGAGNGAALLLLIVVLTLAWLLCSSFAVPPSFQTLASQRMVRCWDRVVKAQRKR